MRFFKKLIATSLVLCMVMTNCLPAVAKGGFFSFLFNDSKNEEVVETTTEETILESLELVEESKTNNEEKLEEEKEEVEKETEAADKEEPEADEVLEEETETKNDEVEETTEEKLEETTVDETTVVETTEVNTTESENVSNEEKETENNTIAPAEETTLEEVVVNDDLEEIKAEVYGAVNREFTLSKDWKSRFSGYLTEICGLIIKKGEDSAIDNAHKWNKSTLTDSTTGISIETYLIDYPAEYAPEGYEGTTCVVIDLADKVDTLYSPKDASDLFSFAKIPAQAKNSTQYALDCNIASSFRAIHGLEYLDTSKTTIFTNFFANNYYLEEIDLSHLDTSNAVWMQGMFSRCANLKSLDLSKFDTSNVVCMRGMFAGCYELTSLDLSNFDTSNVTDMMAMFANCREMLSLNLSSFDTSKVENTIDMFRRMTNIPKLDLRSFDTSEVFDATRMFSEMYWLEIIIVSDKFSTASMYEDDVIFENCPRLRGKYGFQMLPTVEICGEIIKFPYGKLFAKIDKDSEDENQRGLFTDVDEVCDDIVFDYDDEPTTQPTTEPETEPESETTTAETTTPETTTPETTTIETTTPETTTPETTEPETTEPETTAPEVLYEVSFDLDGTTFKGSLDQDKFKNLKEGTKVTLPRSTDMYLPTDIDAPTFAGWYTNSDFTGSPVTQITVNSNVTVYAKWNGYYNVTINKAGQYYNLDKGDILYDADTYTLRVRKGESIVIPVNDSGQFKLNGYRNQYTRCHPAKDNKTQADKYEIKDSNGEYITIVYSGDTYVPTKNNITVHGKWMIHGGDVWYYEDVYALYGRDPDMGTVIDNPLPKPKANEAKPANATPQKKVSAAGGGSSGGSSGGGGGGSAGGGGSGISVGAAGGGGPALTVGAAGGGGPVADIENTPLTEISNTNEFLMQAAPQQQAVTTQPNEAKTQAEAQTANSATYEFINDLSTWTQNADGTWKMEINIGDSKVAASNGFYKMQNGQANNVAVYYFDANGQMATGWVKDANNNLYYFEPANNENVGKMQYGWKEINGSNYFFASDGKLITNGMTPDGKYVGADGKVVSNGTSLDAINQVNNAYNLA